MKLQTPAMGELTCNYYLFQGNVLQQNSQPGVIMSNMSLVLQRLTRHRSGHYVCRVANSEGENVSNPIQLSILREWTLWAARQQPSRVHVQLKVTAMAVM